MFRSQTNQTGMVIRHPVRRPMTVIEIWRRFFSKPAEAFSAPRFACSKLHHSAIGLHLCGAAAGPGISLQVLEDVLKLGS